ncbi:hypothetical protein KAI87_16540, partial [Myxococcota bacterium]|nr:hypothetical protein [Myxococcota bacterium]
MHKTFIAITIAITTLAFIGACSPSGQSAGQLDKTGAQSQEDKAVKTQENKKEEPKAEVHPNANKEEHLWDL